MIFQTYIIWSNRIHSLKYLRSMTLESKDIRYNKADFVAKTQFLSGNLGATNYWSVLFLWRLCGTIYYSDSHGNQQKSLPHRSRQFCFKGRDRLYTDIVVELSVQYCREIVRINLRCFYGVLLLQNWQWTDFKDCIALLRNNYRKKVLLVSENKSYIFLYNIALSAQLPCWGGLFF